ncbi:MAG: penicillin-binding protein 1C, partial [Desulfovibrionales bacterium]|nr:penicillin-binding protein 1C [Desulfovibrionales bacterium]
ALAFDQGHLVPESRLLDVPTDFAGYAPQNYGQNFQGLVSARYALAQSLNVPAVRLLASCGVPAFHNLLVSLGLTTLDRPSQHYGLALALGGCDVRLLDLVNAYATLASGGLHREPRPVVAGSFAAPNAGSESILSAGACAMTLDILHQVTRPNLPDAWDITRHAQHIAWKTGTSFGHRDAWAMGVGHGLAIGVWAGNPDGSACADISGARHAGPLLFDLFRAVRSGSVPTATPEAADLIHTTVCADSGLAPGAHCPVILSPAIAGVTRLAPCTMHQQIFVHAHTGLRLQGDCLTHSPVREITALFWPAELLAWSHAQGSPVRKPPSFAPECLDISTEITPVISSPSSQTPYVLRQDAPAEFQRLALSAVPASGATLHYWYVDGRFVGQSSPGAPCFVPLEPGNHAVHVTDNNGRSASSTYMVTAP